jgi:hypothetical protein
VEVFNSIIKYLLEQAATWEATYHVNPWIFGILYFGSTIPLYFGYYLIAMSFVSFKNGKLSKKAIDHSSLWLGIFVSCASWIIPYAYVLIFGRLQSYLLLFFAIFVLVTGALFIRTLMKRISKAEKK